MRVQRAFSGSSRWLAASWLALAILYSATFASAEDVPVKVQAAVDPRVVAVGDPITYTLTVTWKSGVTIFPPSGEAPLGEFETLGFTASEPVENDGGYSQSFAYTIAVYATGERTIPQVVVSYSDASGRVGAVAVPEVTIAVDSVIDNEEPSLRPIKDPLTIPPRLSRIVLVLLPGSGLVAVVLLYLLWWRRRPKQVLLAPTDAAPPLSPEEQAYRELDEIAARALLDDGKMKEHYTLVSEVLRRYLGRRFRIQTLERTTSEILSELDPVLDDRGLGQPIKEFLRDCDVVKFAKYVPPPVDQQRLITRAQGIVAACAPALQGGAAQESVSPVNPASLPSSAPLGRTPS